MIESTGTRKDSLTAPRRLKTERFQEGQGRGHRNYRQVAMARSGQCKN